MAEHGSTQRKEIRHHTNPFPTTEPAIPEETKASSHCVLGKPEENYETHDGKAENVQDRIASILRRTKKSYTLSRFHDHPTGEKVDGQEMPTLNLKSSTSTDDPKSKTLE
jgi:hypothetical protein